MRSEFEAEFQVPSNLHFNADDNCYRLTEAGFGVAGMNIYNALWTAWQAAQSSLRAEVVEECAQVCSDAIAAFKKEIKGDENNSHVLSILVTLHLIEEQIRALKAPQPGKE